jgi:hypothetical protein
MVFCKEVLNEKEGKLGVPTTMLTWISEKPTKPGWYWYRAQVQPQRLEITPQVVLIEQYLDNRLVMSLIGTDERLPIPHGQWAGPLEPPG